MTARQSAWAHLDVARTSSTSPRTQPLLTIRQTADLMQVSDKTVRRRIADGSLTALRIGSQWRIQRCDLSVLPSSL